MATTLYLTNVAAAYTPATIRGTWASTASHVVRALAEDKLRDYGAVDSVTLSETSASDTYNLLLGRFVSPPLAVNTTVSGTLNLMAGVDVSATDTNAHWYLHAFVTQGDSDSLRGTLLDNYSEALGVNEWPDTDQGWDLNAAQTVSDVSATAGDRIVLEVGCVCRNTTTASRSVQLWYGLTNGYSTIYSNLTQGANPATAVGFVTFSQTLDFSTDVAVTQHARDRISSQVATVRTSQFVRDRLIPVYVPGRVTQMTRDYIYGPVAVTRVTQFLRDRISVAPIYVDGPPTAGENPCVQHSFEAWLELDL